MIKIIKGKSPKSLVEYKKKEGSTFEGLPSTVKSELRTSLLKEQKYICAYCMQRITDDSSKSKIEHYTPRGNYDELEYSNLFIVCTGGEGSTREKQTCDTKKGNTLLEINPTKEEHINTIKYKSTGIIETSDVVFKDDINKTLNLNDKNGYLISNRKAALEELKRKLSSKGGTRSTDYIEKLYNDYKNQEEYVPYIGIILWYLKRKKA